MNNKSDNPTWFIDQLTLYQAANSSPEAIKRNFLIRIAEFELIVSDLKRKQPGDPMQHELILGRRGSGKSTLLRRIQIEIDEDAELAKNYLAINLAEEQAGIYRLSDLWFEVLQELMLRLKEPKKLRDFDDFDDNHAYTRYLYTEIHQLLRASGKKVVLLLDNLDRILQNFDDDGHLLRETLLNYNDLQIIGGSTRMDEHFWQHDKPFYEFFRRHRLEGLRFEEIHLLLDHWSAEMNLPELQGYALRHRGRIEAIRILTDGLPRALQFFIQVLLHDSTSYGFDYLRKVMDKASPLYQERLNNLTPPQRKIIQEMAFWWETVPTKTLVEKCRMESKKVSHFLQQLEGYGIVETLSTGKKNHLYRISERFFNMWLIVTQGNPDQKRKAKYLTLFLEAWYDGVELKVLAQQHLEQLRKGELSYDKALVLSKGLAQSRFIGVEERDNLIDYTLQLDASTKGCSELPRKFKEILKEINQLKEKNNIAEALTKVEEIENEDDGVKFFIKGFLYKELNKNKEVEKYYLKSIEKGYVESLNNLAVLYSEEGKINEATHYYLQAIAKGHINALYNLAKLYDRQGKSEKSEQYYLKAIEKGHINALNNLANLYEDRNEYDKAKYYYLQAIEKGHINALSNLANLYAKHGKNNEAESYYMQSIKKGNVDALYNLAILYTKQQKNVEAELNYLQAIEKGHINALIGLANLYYRQGKYEKAEHYYLQAIEKDDVEALNNLAVFYQSKGKNAEAESYYLQAIEKDVIEALNNLAVLYRNQGKNAEAELYYLKAIEKGQLGALYNLANLYANQNLYAEAELYYLQAIEKGYLDALNNLAVLYRNQHRDSEAELYYLQAIEKGYVDALSNLGVLYREQGRDTEAELYYLQAIEKGQVSALYNLASLYYETAQNPKIALEKMRQYYTDIADERYFASLVILEIWNGIFDNLSEKIEQVLQNSQDKDLTWFITNLLYHEQKQLVLSLFESEQHGKMLKTRYELLYYATLILMKKTKDNLLLRIPPEVLPTVEEIVEEVRKKQVFYAEKPVEHSPIPNPSPSSYALASADKKGKGT